MTHDFNDIYDVIRDRRNEGKDGEDHKHKITPHSSFFNNKEAVNELIKRKDTTQKRDVKENTLTASDNFLLELFSAKKELQLDINSEDIIKRNETSKRCEDERGLYSSIDSSTFLMHQNSDSDYSWRLKGNNRGINHHQNHFNLDPRQPLLAETEYDLPPEDDEIHLPLSDIHMAVKFLSPTDVTPEILLQTDSITLIEAVEKYLDENDDVNTADIIDMFHDTEGNHAFYDGYGQGIYLDMYYVLEQYFIFFNTKFSGGIVPNLYVEEILQYIKWLIDHERFHHIVFSSWHIRDDLPDTLFYDYLMSLPRFGQLPRPRYHNYSGACYFHTNPVDIPNNLPPSVNHQPTPKTTIGSCDICKTRLSNLGYNLPDSGHWFFLEEALANEYAFRKCRPGVFKNFLQEFEKEERALGYRHFHLFKNSKSYKNRDIAYLELEKIIKNLPFDKGPNLYHDTLLWEDYFKNQNIDKKSQEMVTQEKQQLHDIFTTVGIINKPHFIDEKWGEKGAHINVLFIEEECRELCRNFMYENDITTLFNLIKRRLSSSKFTS